MSADALRESDALPDAPDSEELAKRGDIDAQFNLALRYQDGDGVEQDYEKAGYWFRQAAQQGHSAAQYSLALMYCKGLGVDNDDRQSAAWYRMAAEQGHQAAQFNLAVMYDEGTGVECDPIMAYVWFALAGAKGDKAKSFPHNSKGSIAFRLALSGAKGTTIADGHRNRMALKLSESDRKSAEQLAQDYYKKYVFPFR